MDESLTRMRIKINTLDEDIRSVVREQAETGHDGRQVRGGYGEEEGRERERRKMMCQFLFLFSHLKMLRKL